MVVVDNAEEIPPGFGNVDNLPIPLLILTIEQGAQLTKSMTAAGKKGLGISSVGARAVKEVTVTAAQGSRGPSSFSSWGPVRRGPCVELKGCESRRPGNRLSLIHI